MRTPRIGGMSALLALILLAVSGSVALAAGNGASVERFPIDIRFEVEEDPGDIVYFELTGQMVVTTTPNGRSSTVIHLLDSQRHEVDGQIMSESTSRQLQRVLTVDDEPIVFHVTSKNRVSSGGETSQWTFVFQVVNGEVKVSRGG